MNAHAEPELTLRGGDAIHRQIQTQIRDHIVSGELRSGEQLPTVREMAVELAVNPGAVSRALRELEHEGFLTSEEGSGTFVAVQPSARSNPGELESLCQDFLVQAAGFGFSSTDVIDTIQMLIEGRLAS